MAGETAAALERAASGGVPPDELGAAVGVAGDLISKLRIADHHSGIPAVDAEVVTAAEGERLKAALLGVLRASPDARLAGAVVWVLGRTGDPALMDVVTGELRRGLEQLPAANGLVYNAVLALSDLGQPSTEAGGQSLTAVERNIRQARAYLSRNGVLVPW